MGDVASLSIKVTQEGADQAAASLRGLTHAGGGAEASFGKLAMQIAGLNTGFGLAVQAGQKTLSVIKDLSVQSVQLAASFEKSRITWGVLVGDMEMGTKVFEQIRQFSAETPLSFEGLNQAATTIKGFGVATEDLIPTLSKLGDIAMGDNQRLQQLSLVYGQVMAQGKAKTQDLYQFINAGVPIFNLLAESMNKSAGEIKELASEGAVTFDEIEKAINKATSEGGQFYGLMDKVAESAAGKWSTAIDTWDQSLARLGEKTLPMLTEAVTGFTTIMNNMLNLDAMKEFFKNPIAFKGSFEEVLAGLNLQYKDRYSGLEPGQFGFQFASTDAALKYRKQLEQIQYYQTLAEVEAQERARRDAANRPLPAPAPVKWDYPIELAPLYDFSGGLGGNLSGHMTELGKSAAEAFELALYDIELGPILDLSGGLQGGVGAPSLTTLGENAAGAVPDPREIEASAEALRKFEASLLNIKDSMAQMGAEAFVDTFKNIGYDLASGALGADTFAESISNIAQTILNNMPLMLFQAGINAMATPGMFYVGLGLLAASGVVAIGGGAMNYAMEDNASGGVYNSRSLSAYSGGIYDKPQLFNFARGAAIGRFGEAGPEAIVPLQRMGNGKLGVASAGGGNVSVVVNNNAPNTTATATETTGADGTRQIAVIVKGLVKQGMANGEFDASMTRYGARPVGQRK